MEVYYPGRNVIPVAILFAAFLLSLTPLKLEPLHSVWSLWPAAVIGAGIEELYFWSKQRLS